MYYFYVLYSLKDQKLYKGYTSDLGSRFKRHNNGGVKSTKNRRPLILIYSESYNTKTEALARERWSKSKTGGPMLKVILVNEGILDETYCLRGSSTG